MADTVSETSRIESDLDQTRSRLGSHLNELQDRLSPGQVLDDLMGYFRGSEGAEFGRSLLANVRGNPMPAAITTIGLAWLMASKPRPATSGGDPVAGRSAGSLGIYGQDDHHATMERLDSARAKVGRLAGETDHAYSARVDMAHGEAIGFARHPEETTESFGQRIRHAVSAVQQSVTAKGHDLRDQAGGMASAAAGAAGSAGASAQGAVQDALSYAGGALSSGGRSAGQVGGNLIAAITESPVMLGAFGLAAGALLGALLPQSDQEEAALGGIAGQAKDVVRSLADQGLEKGGRVMQAVTDIARDSAQKHGLTGDQTPGQLVDAALSGDLARNVKQVASVAMQAGEEAVRKG